jgi:hypothetical protein
MAAKSATASQMVSKNSKTKGRQPVWSSIRNDVFTPNAAMATTKQLRDTSPIHGCIKSGIPCIEFTATGNMNNHKNHGTSTGRCDETQRSTVNGQPTATVRNANDDHHPGQQSTHTEQLDDRCCIARLLAHRVTRCDHLRHVVDGSTDEKTSLRW